VDGELLPVLVVAVLAVALLYSSVGHAGASGYIAVMSLAGLAPAEIRPTALLLNVLVASITSLQFHRAGHFSWSLFWPFALLAVPLSFLGGALELPTRAFRVLVGLVLLASAANLLLRPPPDVANDPPARALALGLGAGIGLFAGLTGTGGGVFLTPVLLFRHWARAKSAAAVSALFILVNSLAGLAGNVSSTRELPGVALALAGAVAVGGFAGSWLGSRRLPHGAIKRLLAVVLVTAGGKLLLGP
jgi:hypothetical protein